jgi:glutamyl-Q tRNA(Asp) synthetase
VAGSSYRGRFAPSPTGPLHFGSLVAAVGSYLDARAHHGHWFVRIEDVDITRCSPHWATDILRSLEVFGFTWDGPVVNQTSADRQVAYAEALHRLQRAGSIYACGCSRKEIGNSSTGLGLVYPGTCRNGLAPGKTARCFRLCVNGCVVGFIDRSFGPIEQILKSAVGDFILKRADGPFSYQLAVVVDDAEQGITDIVRGEDLLDNTPRQIYLQRLLGYPEPRYLHVRLVTNVSGQKLSKQTGADPLLLDHARPLLVDALVFLGLNPSLELRASPLDDIWRWGIAAWRKAQPMTSEARGGPQSW